MEKREIKKHVTMTPKPGFCFQNKKGHKFIHTSGKFGLPLFIEDTEEAKAKFVNEYTQVKI